jgi:hypothetical protein
MQNYRNIAYIKKLGVADLRSITYIRDRYSWLKLGYGIYKSYNNSKHHKILENKIANETSIIPRTSNYECINETNATTDQMEKAPKETHVNEWRKIVVDPNKKKDNTIYVNEDD